MKIDTMEHTDRFDEYNDLPWDDANQQDKGESGSALLEINLSGDVPIDSYDCKSNKRVTDKSLDIYRKAERFQTIKLTSGNRIEGGVTEQYVREHYGTEGVRRYKLAKFVLSRLDYQASPDVLLMLSSTKKARIVIATAGAGKTTSLQFDLLISKLIDKAVHRGWLEPEKVEDTSVELSRILYLNYNKHNVEMIRNRHTAMCSAINKIVRSEDAINADIESSTVHAFCHKWLKAFSSIVDLPELSIITEEQKSSVWKAIMEPRWIKFYSDDKEAMVDYAVLDELYNFKTESMLEWEQFFDTAKFIDSGLKEDFVKSCIKKYDSMKKAMKLMDFTDYLVLMTNLLKENPELRNKLRNRYRIVIADENQDFTRLMNELLIQLYSPDVNSLIVVGDPDQTIYDFKGVSPDNIVTLAEDLDDVELLGLDTNYRCPDNIVTAAKAILDLNQLRFDKPINTVRTGGKIITHPIDSGDTQEGQVLNILRNLNENDLPQVVITYRNNASSVIMAEELYYAGIPFRILDSHRPFNNPVFRHISMALRALKEKDNFNLNCELYRFLPMSKEQWTDILESNRLERRNHLHDIVVPANLPKGSADAFKLLMKVSLQVETQPVCDFINPLIRLYRMYYFDFIIRQNTFVVSDVDVYPRYLDRAIKYFSRQMTYDYMMAEMIERNVDNELGVTLSTFHGLKGLEFDYVLALDFEESVFPRYFELEQQYSLNTTMEEKESANRLCYVLVTRTIKELHLFYNSTDPSVYVNLLTKSNPANDEVSKQDEISLGGIGTFDSVNAKMNFVRGILGRR